MFRLWRAIQQILEEGPAESEICVVWFQFESLVKMPDGIPWTAQFELYFTQFPVSLRVIGCKVQHAREARLCRLQIASCMPGVGQPKLRINCVCFLAR